MVACLEVAINRVLIGSQNEPGLAAALVPAKHAPPAWLTALSYAGLFLFYFAGTLATALIAAHVVTLLRERRGVRELVPNLALAAATLLAAVPLVIPAPAWLSFPLEVAFALAVIAVTASGFARDRDVGVQIGLIVLAVPLLLHTVSVLGAKFWWPESAFDTAGDLAARAGAIALCVAALVSPYVFSPRPFARAVTRPLPVIAAMTAAALGAFAARMWYPPVARAAALAIGIELTPHQPDPRLALYLLAIATLVWTLISCAFAASAARRTIGAGLALIVLGGYGFHWPDHYLLPLLGLALVADAAGRVRDEELANLPFEIETPAVADAAWAGYIGAVTTTLKRSLGDVHALTTRGDGGLASSVIVGERGGLNVRARVERIEGSVIALDVVVGREIDELRGATVSLWAVPAREHGPNPPGPAAAPPFRTGDAPFDERFRARGSAAALGKLFDGELRARAVASLDGWLAYWEPEGVRYRVYPGRGAPIDHPMPLSDLALGRPGGPERLALVIELVAELGARGVTAAAPDEPAHLEEKPA